MDNKKKELLRHHQQAIVNDLDVVYVVDELYSKHAITAEELEEICNRKLRSDRARYLIDILIQRGNNTSYEAFVDCLAKDYNWLWQKLTVETNGTMLNESFEDSLSIGNVPRLPKHYVKRDDVEKDVAKKLNALTRHKILVLHGMSGSGKTSLAISVLRSNSDLITDNFNGSVFWHNLNNCKTEDDIIAQQNALYKKAMSMYTRNSHMNSTMTMSSSGSNFDTQSLSSSEWTWQELKDRLKSQFSEPVLKDALLVLDEVNDKLCVDAFDIGCRLLITTRDSDVVANFHPDIIEIKNSLKEEQTLKLLASYVERDVSQLPKQARKFHDACKGSPFNVTLIGAQLAEDKERLWHDNRRWDYYLKKLEKREFWIFPIPDNNPMKTIKVCIDSLDPQILPLFKKLAILPHNVRVSPKVLGKLWNIESFEVVQIMNKLHRKSLITKSYVNEQKSYIYELHDLIMNYLRTCLNDDETNKTHSELLKNYQYGNVEQPPIDIVDDGYIAFYMGYHILNTKNLNNKWKLFNLYLNLKFLGNKIRLTGQADVILDLEKYETYIVENEPNRLFVNSIKAYLKTYGTDLYRYPHTDIVQSILQHESEGLLYGRALDIARKNASNNELYFDFVHKRDVEEIKYSTIDAKEIITSVCFLGDYVLVGTITGQVKFFHIPTNTLKKELSGTSTSIRWVGACPARPSQVAALTNDGFIKLWHVDDIEQDDAEDIIEEESDEVDNNNYPTNCTINPKMGPFLNCRWSNHQKTLITHTSNMIMIYNCDGTVEKVFDNFEKNEEVLCCVPCNNDKYIIVAVATNGVYRLEVIKQSNKEKVMTFTETDKVLDILTVPGSNKILTLKSTEITVHEYKMKFPTGNSYHTCRCNVILTAKDVKDNLMFLALAVNKTGSLMFVSTDDSRVVCVDLKTNSRLFDLENRRGNVISMAVSEVVWNDFEPGSDVLLTGTGTVENSAKVWNLEASYVLHNTQRNSKVRLTKKFDVSFVNAASPHTPTSSTCSSSQSVISSPRRHQSFANHTEVPKRQITTSLSLERHSLKPLNLKGISNNNELTFQPLLAVVDDKNNIQVMRGKKVLTEVLTRPEDKITTIKISPCNHYVIYGLESGVIKKYTLRSKEVHDIMDMNSPVHYLKFVTPLLLIAGSKDYCLMVYRLTSDGMWKTDMLQRGKTFLASQEILNDLQGVKIKTSHADTLSSSGSEASVDSKRVFNSANSMGRLRRNSGLVDCFWLKDVGMISIENNAVVKLWDLDMKLVSVLNANQRDASETVTCAAFQKNILVICDGNKPGFQTFELKHGDQVELRLIQDTRLNNRITSCDLTSDGYILAMGLESGEVVIWNVPAQRQIRLLKHHKNAVQCCMFSPVPDRWHRSTSQNSPSPSPFSHPPAIDVGVDDNVPLVLVTMASEIVWWNVTYMLNARSNKSLVRTGRNALTPLPIPNDNRIDPTEAVDDQNNQNTTCNNFFFGNSLMNSQCGFKSIWKGKKCKEGSKKKEILSCIKLSGMNAKKLCRDDKFACFVTVDNSGHIHIMNVMKANKS